MRIPAILGAAAVASLLATSALAAPEGWAPLLEPQELNSILETNEDVRVIRVSGAYNEGHIPGAVESAYAEWRGPAENPGALRDLAHFTDLVQELGIEADTPVVVVHQGSDQTDMGTAARVYWTLKSLGVEDLALLNGGFEAWKKAGLPVETDVVEVAASGFEPRWSDEWRVTTSEVEQLVETGDARLIDARPENFFQGLMWTIADPGTLPGAGNLTYDKWFEGERMVGPDEAARIAAEYGQDEAPVTVSFCNTGHWAAINWFALSELAGIEDTKLYAESMAEWTMAERPVANQPSAVTYYWLSTKRWVADLI